jgi:hypothetical protein
LAAREATVEEEEAMVVVKAALAVVARPASRPATLAEATATCRGTARAGRSATTVCLTSRDTTDKSGGTVGHLSRDCPNEQDRVCYKQVYISQWQLLTGQVQAAWAHPVRMPD